jgi:hypothetical protein
LRNSVDNANKILGGENCIDVFGPAEADPKVPIETTSEVLCNSSRGQSWLYSFNFPKFELTLFGGRPMSKGRYRGGRSLLVGSGFLFEHTCPLIKILLQSNPSFTNILTGTLRHSWNLSQEESLEMRYLF